MDRTFSINRLSKRIDYSSKHSVTYRYLYYSSGRLYDIALSDIGAASKKYRSDIVLLKIEHHAVYFSRKFQKFSLHRLFEAVNTCNTVCYLNNSTCVRHRDLGGVSLNLFFDYGTNFLWS